MEVTSLPDHVLGRVFSQITSPADRMSVLLACKRFLSAALTHSPTWWESITVSDNKGDRQGSFWVAHHRHVRSLDVAITALGGGPGAFLHLVQGLAPGLPALETLKIMAPCGRNRNIMQVWMEQAFQAINALSGLRHLHLREERRVWEVWDEFYVQPLPLLLAPGALPRLQSLVLEAPWNNFRAEVPPGALRALGSLTRLHVRAKLAHPGSSDSYDSYNDPPFVLGWADLEGTTALRHLYWHPPFMPEDDRGSCRLSLSESEALSLLGRLEQLSVAPVACFSQGIWEALPQLPALTRVALSFEGRQMDDPTANSAPMRAVAACRNLKALSTNWLPPIHLTPGQLSSLTRLVLTCSHEKSDESSDTWLAAMPALESLDLHAEHVPPGLEALPSLKSLYFYLYFTDADDEDDDEVWQAQRAQQVQQALDRISSLPHLTSLELELFEEIAWPLPPGPYLSNLRSLWLKWVDAAAPIPPALADASCLTSLTLFPFESPRHYKHLHKGIEVPWKDISRPPAAWEADDVALLRALPCLEKVELVCREITREDWDVKTQGLPPEWQHSAAALAAQLPGVSVTARQRTQGEVDPREL